MKQRIEVNDSFPTSPYFKTRLDNPAKSKTQQLLNYKTWRNNKNNHRSTLNLHIRSNSKKKCSFKTLLGEISQIRTQTKYNFSNTLKQNNNQPKHKQLLIKTINFNQNSNDPLCQIIINLNSKSFKKFYHKASTTDKLIEFLTEKYHKIYAWKNSPQNLALDYYLSLKSKDISFLNGQTINLQPYKLQKQSIVNINSFQIICCIGTGGFSKVFLCRFKEDGRFYAMKVIEKNFIVKNKKKKIVMNEKKIMQKLKHPFIIQMKFAFQSKSSLIFVLELCPGGELFGLVKKFRIMNQSVSRFYIIQILLGIEEIHKNGIVYRDFKPENILIDLDGHIRIADFGLAKPGITSIKQKAYSFCGSPQYMPPQMILKKGHSLPVDFYCLGALLYQLVTGLPPFYSQNPNQIYQGTLSKSISFPSHAKLSDQLKQLLKSLLCKDQFKRLGTIGGVKQVLAHPWFRKVDKQVHLCKQSEPPVRFTGIKDLNLIFSEIKIKKSEYIQDLIAQQINQQVGDYEPVMDNFYFDYRQRNSLRLSHRSKKQNSFSMLSLKSNRNSAKNMRPKQKTLRSIFSQRSMTGCNSIRKKPLTTRCFDLKLFIR